MLDDDRLVARREELVLQAAARWMAGGEDGVRGPGLLRAVRFGAMGDDFLVGQACGVVPVECRAWIVAAVAEALAAKAASRGADQTGSKAAAYVHLGPKALVRRAGRGVRWELCSASGEGTPKLAGGGGALVTVAEGPGGRVCAGSVDGEIQVWDGATLALERTLREPGRGVVFALAAWDDCLVSGHGDGRLVVWGGAGAGGRQRVLSGHRGAVRGLSGAGPRLASGSDDGTVRVWGGGAAAGECERALRGDGGCVRAVAMWGGRAAGGGADGKVRVWDAASGALEATLAGHGGGVSAVAAAGDRLYTAGADGVIRAWAAGTWGLVAAVAAKGGLGEGAWRVQCLAVSGARLVSGSVAAGAGGLSTSESVCEVSAPSPLRRLVRP